MTFGCLKRRVIFYPRSPKSHYVREWECQLELEGSFSNPLQDLLWLVVALVRVSSLRCRMALGEERNHKRAAINPRRASRSVAIRVTLIASARPALEWRLIWLWSEARSLWKWLGVFESRSKSLEVARSRPKSSEVARSLALARGASENALHLCDSLNLSRLSSPTSSGHK